MVSRLQARSDGIDIHFIICEMAPAALAGAFSLISQYREEKSDVCKVRNAHMCKMHNLDTCILYTSRKCDKMRKNQKNFEKTLDK